MDAVQYLFLCNGWTISFTFSTICIQFKHFGTCPWTGLSLIYSSSLRHTVCMYISLVNERMWLVSTMLRLWYACKGAIRINDKRSDWIYSLECWTFNRILSLFIWFCISRLLFENQRIYINWNVLNNILNYKTAISQSQIAFASVNFGVFFFCFERIMKTMKASPRADQSQSIAEFGAPNFLIQHTTLNYFALHFSYCF